MKTRMQGAEITKYAGGEPAQAGHRTAPDGLSGGLYGRDREVARIREAFHWTTLGSTQLISVSGPSGIGKTAVIQEALHKISLEEAYLIAGKFESLQQDTPMSPLIGAFRELTEQLLNEDKRSLEQWREAILQALGVNAAVITDVIPEMERIIGRQASVEQLPLEEAMERFQFVFRRFIQVFCHQKHPLVLVMDDLQWADEASWRMIRSFMSDPQSQSLLLIGAFRDTGEIGRIEEELGAIASSGVTVQSLPLGPLGPVELTRIVGDTLGVSDGIADDIAHTLLLRSDGNPFLFRRLLQRSMEEEVLRYDEPGGGWVWNWKEPDPAAGSAHADLLLNYMTDSINRLPADTRQALLEASCLGGESPLALLASWRGETPERTLDVLRPAMERQLIMYAGSGTPETAGGGRTSDPGAERMEEGRIRFVHDRLQEAANALFDTPRSEEVHWHAGRYWLRHSDPALRERHVFDAAGHLNKGSRLARLPEDRNNLIRANAGAGGKAKSATAYEAAAAYFGAAAAFITEEHWERDFDFCFDLFVDLLECEYMNGWQPSTYDTFHALLGRARTAYERMRVQHIEINRLLHTERMADGIELGIACLRDLGIHVSVNTGKTKLFAELLVTKEHLRRKIGRLRAKSSVSDPVITVALQVLTQLSGAAFICDRPLFRALTFKCVRLSLKYGNFPHAAAVFGSLGGILNQALGDLELARASLKEGMRIAVTYKQPSILCRAHLTMGVMFFIMEDEDKDLHAHFRKSIDYGLEAGDLFFTGHSVVMLLVNLHMVGKLDRLEAVVPEYKKMLADTQNHYLLPYITIIERWLHALKGTGAEPGANQDDQELLLRIGRSGMESNLLYQYGLSLLQEGYTLGDRDLAIRGADMARKHEQDATHYLHRSEYELYYGLTLLNQGPGLSAADTRALAACRRSLRRSAAKCPEHIRHKSLLLESSYAEARGKLDAAGRLYDDAIREARRSGYEHHAALACECAGRMYVAQSRETTAKGYLIEAHALYRQWGAARKADQIREQYAAYCKELAWEEVAAAAVSAPTAAMSVQESGAVAAGPDLSVVQQAFQSMAAESDQRALIENSIRTVMEFAGAQRGCIVMEHAKRLTVELAADQEGGILRQPVPVERFDEVCLPAVRYTANTGEILLIEHAAAGGRLARDPYVMSCQIQSMLCLPLHFQNRLTAVLYLENNRRQGAFRAEQLDMLRMLATQTVFLLKLFPYDDGQAAPVNDTGADTKTASGQADAESAGLMDPLTKRELEVLQFMSLGMTNQEIAQQLHIAVGTVKLHTNRIFSKMNVNRRAKAVLEAKRMKLLNDNDAGSE
ncbi:AAA family ATPase [Paenibacillus rhizovicinus]|uniref:AAA family ATPase n=1 Tax=Paenibacillus rhizovicinus TaxID=2704463 RepID=A0A6C0P1F8_9BACL|nr:AAA family ATPase [Paenibacillus rhizovicinus]QHW32308.1 AAA family ATPase [Paenibacillus rhizovicinus]